MARKSPLPVVTQPSENSLRIEGLCHNTDDGSDKVWGYFSSSGSRGAFWGKRTGPWTFKVEAEYGRLSWLHSKFREKINGGYREVSDPTLLGKDFRPGLNFQFTKNMFFGKLHEREALRT